MCGVNFYKECFSLATTEICLKTKTKNKQRVRRKNSFPFILIDPFYRMKEELIRPVRDCII